MGLKLEMSAETRALLNFLETKPAEFTYDQCRNVTGINDMSRLRSYIYTCLRRLKKQGVWYRPNRGIGYRRVNEAEKNGVQGIRINKVAKGTRRIDSDQSTINVSILSRDAKLEFTFNSARIGRMLEASSRKAKNEIKREIANGNLPIGG